MTTEQRIDEICLFLREKVCSQIQLKKPDDDAPLRVEWINPDVHPAYMPSPRAGQDWLSSAPCLVVMPLKDLCSRDSGTLTVRVGVMTWDPGTRTSNDGGMALEMDRDGWRGLHTLMDRVERELAAHATVGDMEVGYPIEKSPFQDEERVPDLRPYYLGQIDIPMNYILPRRLSRDIEKLLE